MVLSFICGATSFLNAARAVNLQYGCRAWRHAPQKKLTAETRRTQRTASANVRLSAPPFRTSIFLFRVTFKVLESFRPQPSVRLLICQ